MPGLLGAVPGGARRPGRCGRRSRARPCPSLKFPASAASAAVRGHRGAARLGPLLVDQREHLRPRPRSRRTATSAVAAGAPSAARTGVRGGLGGVEASASTGPSAAGPWTTASRDGVAERLRGRTATARGGAGALGALGAAARRAAVARSGGAAVAALRVGIRLAGCGAHLARVAAAAQRDCPLPGISPEATATAPIATAAEAPSRPVRTGAARPLRRCAVAGRGSAVPVVPPACRRPLWRGRWRLPGRRSVDGGPSPGLPRPRAVNVAHPYG